MHSFQIKHKILNLLHYSDKLISNFWVGGRGTVQKSLSGQHRVKPCSRGCTRMCCGFTARGKKTAAVSGSELGLPDLRQMLENMRPGRQILPTERRRRRSSFHNMCSKFEFEGISLIKHQDRKLSLAFSLKMY